jgi:hypothetical protein
MPEHQDRPPSALAHGPATCSDIERVRRDVDEVDAHAVHAEEASVARHRQRVSSRATQDPQDARP